MILKVKKLNKFAVLPFYATEGSVGMDLTVTSVKSNSLFKIKYGFGISTQLPVGTYAKMFSRSSVMKRLMWLSNGVGIIDSDYRGEWMAVFYKIPFFSKKYKVGERACQFIVSKYEKVEIKRSKFLSKSKRGTGGYGHTGKK